MTKYKTIYGLKIRFKDNEEWSNTTWFKTRKERDRTASVNRIIGGLRTYSFQERKPVEEIEETIMLND